MKLPEKCTVAFYFKQSDSDSVRWLDPDKVDLANARNLCALYFLPEIRHNHWSPAVQESGGAVGLSIFRGSDAGNSVLQSKILDLGEMDSMKPSCVQFSFSGHVRLKEAFRQALEPFSPYTEDELAVFKPATKTHTGLADIQPGFIRVGESQESLIIERRANSGAISDGVVARHMVSAEKGRLGDWTYGEYSKDLEARFYAPRRLFRQWRAALYMVSQKWKPQYKTITKTTVAETQRTFRKLADPEMWKVKALCEWEQWNDERLDWNIRWQRINKFQAATNQQPIKLLTFQRALMRLGLSLTDTDL